MTEKEIRDLFGYNLKRIRKLRNISQMQLADKVDMNFSFINAIENGKKWVSPESIAKFTEALEIESYHFFLPKDFLSLPAYCLHAQLYNHQNKLYGN